MCERRPYAMLVALRARVPAGRATQDDAIPAPFPRLNEQQP
ncbi:hypothetical protein BURCENK562V_C7472 [Burkholderia cenocepacia K56-2Valvano]|nr:hypothetical protein BURCENK562V_C7472 [Burkholderia cenocepacia K56-2Valvano]